MSFQMYKAKSNKELWAFLFNDFLLLTHAVKQFTSSGLDKLFSNKSNVQLKMYKPVNRSVVEQMGFIFCVVFAIVGATVSCLLFPPACAPQ